MSVTQTELFRQLWEAEYENTVQVLKAIPDAQLHFVPYDGAMSLRSLALHVIQLEEHFIQGVHRGVLVAGGSRVDRAEAQSAETLLSLYEAQHADLRPIVAAFTDEQLSVPVSFRMPNGPILFSVPGVAHLFRNLLNHMIHHRAQLLVYLRLLGQPIPGLYGPTRENTPGAR